MRITWKRFFITLGTLLFVAYTAFVVYLAIESDKVSKTPGAIAKRAELAELTQSFVAKCEQPAQPLLGKKVGYRCLMFARVHLRDDYWDWEKYREAWMLIVWLDTVDSTRGSIRGYESAGNYVDTYVPVEDVDMDSIIVPGDPRYPEMAAWWIARGNYARPQSE